MPEATDDICEFCGEHTEDCECDVVCTNCGDRVSECACTDNEDDDNEDDPIALNLINRYLDKRLTLHAEDYDA